MSAEPGSTRQIATATAKVESWLPSAQVKTLYMCGLEASQRAPELWDSLRADMDDAAQIIYDKTQMEVRQALSTWLMSAPAPVVQPEAIAVEVTAPQAPLPG